MVGCSKLLAAPITATAENIPAIWSHPEKLAIASMSPEHPLQDASRAVARILPNVRVETLMGQGHWALHEAPEMAARLIVDFLAA